VQDSGEPAGWKQLRRVLRLWGFHAGAAREEALDAPRGLVRDGMPQEMTSVSSSSVRYPYQRDANSVERFD
jgi:hypothetical protein